jgi:hypothetical protein
VFTLARHGLRNIFRVHVLTRLHALPSTPPNGYPGNGVSGVPSRVGCGVGMPKLQKMTKSSLLTQKSIFGQFWRFGASGACGGPHGGPVQASQNVHFRVLGTGKVPFSGVPEKCHFRQKCAYFGTPEMTIFRPFSDPGPECRIIVTFLDRKPILTVGVTPGTRFRKCETVTVTS